MGQILHGSTTTTHAVQAAIQRSQASSAALSRTYGINPKTVPQVAQAGNGRGPQNRTKGATFNRPQPGRGSDHYRLPQAHLAAS